MKTTILIPDLHRQLREALRALCRTFDSAYLQRIDQALKTDAPLPVQAETASRATS